MSFEAIRDDVFAKIRGSRKKGNGGAQKGNRKPPKSRGHKKRKGGKNPR